PRDPRVRRPRPRPSGVSGRVSPLTREGGNVSLRRPSRLAVRGLADGVVDPRRIGRIAPGRFELPSRGLSSACSADPEPRITGPRPHRGHDWPLDHGALIAIQRRGRILTFLTVLLR